MRVVDRHKTFTKFALIVVLAMGLCMMPCGMAEHHGSLSAPSILCIIDLPQVFQLVIALNVLLFATVARILVPQAPDFSLLKPPRFRFALV